MTALEKILSKHIDGGPGAWKKLYDELEEYAQHRTAELEAENINLRHEISKGLADYIVASDKWSSEKMKMEAENARLREALEQISDRETIGDLGSTVSDMRLRQIAKEALEGLGE